MHRPLSWRHHGFLFAAGMLLMGSVPHDASSAPLTGEWGGPQVRFHLTETGGMIDLACASVHIASPLRPGAEGRFTVEVQYEDFAGGPTPADAPPAFTSARVSGRVDGNTMQLSIHRAGDQTTQEFVLERGRRVKLIRCA